jgi:hypothetical protein
MQKVKHRREGVVMYKRFLGTLTVAVALGVAIPVQALAMHAIDSGGSASNAPAPVASVHSTGQNATLHRSGFVFGSSPSLNRYAGSSTGQSSTLFKSASSTPASSDDGFNWGDAGLGVGVLLASLLVATAGALTLRRLRPVAH